MKKCLFFGSFSPLHRGHLKQIKSLIDLGYDVDIVISAHNPHKDINNLLPFDLRKEICKISIEEYFTTEENKKIFINDIENTLSKPNYTYLTLRKLTKKYGEKPIIVMGTDVINSLTTWKNYEEIKEYPIINAHRPGYEINKELEDIYNIVDETSTYDDISSTIIRNLLDTKPEEILDKEYMTKNAYLKLYGV